jgi:SpoVK/Ycf46/Vps4 family AAA+-type ATPase
MNTLWEHIKTINYDPDKIRAMGQAPRINLLLHGPPGTGKSTFAYRIAMATKRHIMNIKLSAVKKDELLTLFSTPKIETQEYKPKDIVYVLDEIDVEIDKMMFKQKRQEEQCKMTKDTITKLIDSTLSDKNRGNQQQNSAPVIVVGNDDKKQGGQSQPPDSQVKSALEMINNLEKVIESMTKAYDKIGGMEGDMVTLSDLLTVFQGAVPVEGCIIIAMTNKYEELTQLCPALFRAGRLSPVEFEHFDMKMLSDVVKMYFGRGIKYATNSQLVIPPSEIMEIITPSLIKKCTYEQFITKLKEKIPSITPLTH